MDYTLIYVTVISMVGGLIMVELLNFNWFRRERFKKDMNFEKKANDLKIKQLARELGVDTKRVPPETPEKKGGIAAAILPELLKNMEPETLASIATNLIGSYGGEGEPLEEGGGGGMGLIEDFIANNPDIVKGFLEGVKGGKKQDQGGFASQV